MILPKATTPVSPKVISGANWSGYATLLLTLLSFITPDSLAFLGHMAPLVYGIVIAVSYTVGAYLKADPLRDAGAAAQAQAAAAAAPAPTIVVNAAPAPVAVPAPDAPPADATEPPAPADPAAPAGN